MPASMNDQADQVLARAWALLDVVADDGIPLTVTCRVPGLLRTAVLQVAERPVKQWDWDKAHLINAAIHTHGDDPGSGYRFIADQLPAEGPSPGEKPGLSHGEGLRADSQLPHRCP